MRKYIVSAMLVTMLLVPSIGFAVWHSTPGKVVLSSNGRPVWNTVFRHASGNTQKTKVTDVDYNVTLMAAIGTLRGVSKYLEHPIGKNVIHFNRGRVNPQDSVQAKFRTPYYYCYDVGARLSWEP